MSLVVQLNEAVEKFLEYQKVRKGRTIDTINTYRSALGQFVCFTGNIEVKDLTVELIDNYADTLVFHKPKTLKNKLTPIRSFIAYLYAKNHISLRKESIELPTVIEIEANFLDPSEQLRMYEACTIVPVPRPPLPPIPIQNTKRELAIIYLLIASGLRVSELINLRVDDVYKRSILVRHGKGGKTRTSYITPEAEKHLIAYQESLIVDNQIWLFPNENGGQLSRQYVHKLVSRVAERAGIRKKVSPHTLRHTFATNLLMAGARAEDVQPMMGHTHIRTTQIYMHFTNAYLRHRYDEFTGPNSVPVL